MPTLISLGGGALVALALAAVPLAPAPAPSVPAGPAHVVAGVRITTVAEAEALIARAEDTIGRIQSGEIAPKLPASAVPPQAAQARRAAEQALARAAVVSLDASVKQAKALLSQPANPLRAEMARGALESAYSALVRSNLIPAEVK